MTGFQVLRWVRKSAGLKNLPVVVLTDSLDHRESRLARELGANSHVVKPCSFDEITREMEQIANRWLGTRNRSGTGVCGRWERDAQRKAA
jgi:DNA-binding response OmpR family regulator